MPIPTLAFKAATLLYSLVRNRALGDGHKRLARLATTVFLDLNRRAPALPDDVAFALVLDVAQGTAQLEATSERLRATF